RSFAAYVLWNRLDTQQHEFYNGPLKDQVYAIPTMSVVIMLKPDFAPPYYVLPWMLIQNGKLREGMDLARQGAENNPRSGLLRMAYAQLLSIKENDWEAAAKQADLALRSDTVWADDVEHWQELRIAEDIYLRVGQKEKAGQVAALLDALSARIDSTQPADALGQSHDHNGDGKPDH
ncbi:MAG TPA: hypothetical protein VF902_09940, partial [Coriobacteriia bacterium]